MQTHDSLARLEECLARWKLSEPVLVAETPTSRVYRVKSRKHGRAALKLLLPEAGEDERYGGVLLDWYEGKGAARVHALDFDAVLLEWLDGQPLSQLVREGKDDIAIDIICQTVALMRGEHALPPPRGLTSLEDRFRALFAVNRTLWPPASRDMLLRAQLVARRLLDTTAEEVVLHGDLHHDNILFSSRSWVAIDPKGLIGDPAYEVANCFINPFTETTLCSSPARIDRMAGRFVARLGLDRTRVLGFAVAHAALSACWELQTRDPDLKHHLAILPRLIGAHLVAEESAR